MLIKGATFNFPVKKLLAECKNIELSNLLARIYEKKFEFTPEEKVQFAQLCCQSKHFPKLFIRSNSCPLLYASDENEIIKVESPIIKLIPELLDLEEALPINEEAGIVSTDPNIYKRVVREMNEVNEDFHSLRTVVTPSVNGMMNVFNFVMYPNDGAFCSLPLIGRIVIPESYPVNPPVFHLFTRTNRYNLDVFNSNAVYNRMESSSICFDLVKPMSTNLSTWRPEFTISTVFASIMSAIVSYKVEQMYGGFKDEAVSMESLSSSMNNVKNEIKNRWKEISKLPKIPIVKAARFMCQEINFPNLSEYEYYELQKGEENIVSDPITLQNGSWGSWTAQFDLKNLTAEYVLSFILTNNPKDIKGSSNQTILFRNGVTATAAKKLPNKGINWFYHGKPLNNGDMSLNITITEKQFVFSYMDESSNGEWIIHGDTPITRLTKKIVGDLSKEKFYLVIYVKNKNKKLGGKFRISQVTTNTGYIHKACEMSE